MDVIASDAWTPDHAEGTVLHEGSERAGAALYFFQNTGNGFEKHIIAEKLKGERLHNGQPYSLLERNFIADINGDGLPDVVAVHLLQDRVLAFLNPGPDEIKSNWPMTVLSRPEQPVEIKLKDMNHDGRVDLVTASYAGGVWISYNNGTAEGWEPEMIGRPDKWDDTRNLLIIGNDIIASDHISGEVALFRKTPDGWKHTIIARNLLLPWHGDVVDWNEDGRPDVIFGDAYGIYVLLNGKRWRLRKVTHVERPVYNARWFEIKMADLDGDGDRDIVATRSSQSGEKGGQLWWFENVWHGWRRHLLKSSWGLANQVHIADLNGDGKPDIVASTEQPHNEVRYWINRGRR